MQIYTEIKYQWSTKQDRYIRVHQAVLSGKWTEIASLKGASAQQTNLANAQASYYNTLTQDYNQQFAAQNNILSALNNSLQPIINAGPNQFGFSTAELNNLNSQAIQGTGQQYAAASKALNEAQAAQGGGNSYLPSGAQAAQKASVAQAGANQASSELLGIQQQGYAQGRQNYQNALGAEEGVAGMYSPTSYASEANQSGGVANSEANEVAKLNNAASPWNVVGGILGGAASAGLDALTGGLGGAAGSALGGLFKSGGGSASAPYGPDSD